MGERPGGTKGVRREGGQEPSRESGSEASRECGAINVGLVQAEASSRE